MEKNLTYLKVWQQGLTGYPKVDAGMRQWVAGCGVDASPFFRIFNPMTQGAKFDPEGIYVRRWVPELELLPNKYLHQPWEAPAEVLEAANVKLGKTYPKPIVSHTEARKLALEGFAGLSKG